MPMIRSRAPLRVSFAGGGTDLEAYSRHHGGLVVNATIDLWAEVTLIPRPDHILGFWDLDTGINAHVPLDALDPDTVPDRLRLSAGVARHVLNTAGAPPVGGVDIYSSVEAPAGSGLGSSSTLTVALVAAWDRWLGGHRCVDGLARTAFRVEREDLGLSGGCQDHWAAAHGGLNRMAIGRDGVVEVSALRPDPDTLNELETSLVLYDTGTSRQSATIIDEQRHHLDAGDTDRLVSMHHLKAQAASMADTLTRGRLELVGPLLEHGWEHKRRTADGITTPLTETARCAALGAGATGVKVSGAGGGGFMLAFCPGVTRHRVAAALAALGGRVRPVRFSTRGVTTWTNESIL
jgi:D-glycero-alpha-D-manno-heptose-7-phosphate kinase